MLYNVAKEGIVEVNTSVGNVSTDFDSMLDLMDNTASISVDGSSGDVFCLDVDLGARVAITDIRYYFTSAASSGTVGPTISFLYKNDSVEDFSAGATMSGSDYYYTTVSGISAPRYIRLIHTISGTSISGTATGFYVINDDTIVDFGDDGTKSYMNIMTAGNTSVVRELAVYNSGTDIADAHVFVEPAGSVSEYISVSNDEGGPWSSMSDVSLASADFSDGCTFDYESGLDTSVVNNQLKISSLADGVGKYTTKIIKKESGTSYSALNVGGTFPNTSALKADAIDGTRTYEIRSNNAPPVNFSYFTSFSWNYLGTNTYSLGRNQFWLSDGSAKYTAADGVYGHFFALDYMAIGEEILPSDPNKGFILIAHDYKVSYYTHYRFTLVRYTKSVRDCTDYWFSDVTKYDFSTASPRVDIVPLRMWADIDDGVWIYYQVTSGPVAAGYYLKYFSYELVQGHSESSSSKIYYDVDVVHDPGYLWVTDISILAVSKISKDGTLLVTYTDELNATDLRGVCATVDGGCWFINEGTAIYELDSEGNLLRSFEDIDLPAEAKYVLLDKDDSGFLWLVSTNYVSLFDLSGERVLFSKYTQDIVNVRSYLGGLALTLSNGYFNFFSKAARSVSASRASSHRIPGVFTAEYSDERFSGNYYTGNDLCVGGSATASSYSSSNYPSNAFNNEIYSRWEASSSSSPQWLKYDLGAGNAAIARSFRVCLASNHTTNFYLQGSNNDSDWEDLTYTHSVTGPLYSWPTFYFGNNTSYRYYRLYITYSTNAVNVRGFEISNVSLSFPNELDVSWNSKQWKKVSYDSHLISSDEYKQFRITMRSDGAADPSIDNIYLYDGVKINSIYPATSKSAYIKVETPADITGNTGVYETNVKVWWEIPV